MIRYLLLSAVAVLSSTLGYGQSAPKYSNEFLQVGVGARWLGMSNAAVTRVDDVTAGFWNPAGLTEMKDKIQIAYMHTTYFAGIGNYDYGALGVKLKDNNALAFSFVRMGIDGIPNTLDLIRNGQIDYSRVTEFSAVDYGFFMSYGQKAKIEGLSFGGSAKIIHRKAGYFAKSYGFGIDAGVQYEMKNGIKLGAMARDVTTTFNAWQFDFTERDKEVLQSTGNEIPTNSVELTLPKIILGGAWDKELNEEFSFGAEVNLDVTTDGKRNTLLRTGFASIDPHFGIELGYVDRIFIRGGIGNIQSVLNPRRNDLGEFDNVKEWTLQPNIGLGLDVQKFALDFAISNLGETADNPVSYIFSLKFKLNGETKSTPGS